MEIGIVLQNGTKNRLTAPRPGSGLSIPRAAAIGMVNSGKSLGSNRGHGPGKLKAMIGRVIPLGTGAVDPSSYPAPRCARRQAAGGWPVNRLKAREKAASES